MDHLITITAWSVAKLRSPLHNCLVGSKALLNEIRCLTSTQRNGEINIVQLKCLETGTGYKPGVSGTNVSTVMEKCKFGGNQAFILTDFSNSLR